MQDIELKIQALKDRGYYDIHKVLPRIFYEIDHHFLLRDNKDCNNPFNKSKLFFDVEYYGAWEYEDKSYPDYQGEFKCYINPEWKYGVWINTEASDPEDTLITIFAQHKWRIDKFKPSYSKFTYDIKLKDMIRDLVDAEANEGGMDILLYDLVNFIILTKHKAISFVMYNGSNDFDKNFYINYLSEWFYYEVKSPIKEKFFKLREKLILKYLVYKAKKDKYLESYEVIDNGENCWPRYTIMYITKAGLDEEELWIQYSKSFKEWIKKNSNIEIDQYYRQRNEDGSLSHGYGF